MLYCLVHVTVMNLSYFSLRIALFLSKFVHKAPIQEYIKHLKGRKERYFALCASKLSNHLSKPNYRVLIFFLRCVSLNQVSLLSVLIISHRKTFERGNQMYTI